MFDISNIASYASDALYLLPEWSIVFGIISVILSQTNLTLKTYNGLFALVLSCISTLCNLPLLFQHKVVLFEGMLVGDGGAAWAKVLVGLGTGLTLLGIIIESRANDTNSDTRPQSIRSEQYMLLLFMQLALNFMIASAHFMTFYLAMEMASICAYALTAIHGGKHFKAIFAAEATVKYLLFGAFASAVMLYGVSLFYGLTGSLSFITTTKDLAATGLQSLSPYALTWVFVMVLTGVGYKLTAAPLHFWAPDVYQTISPIMGGFLSTVPKVAMAFAFIKIWQLFGADALLTTPIFTTFVGLVILTLVWGSFAALRQQHFRRMLAYGAVAQTAFLLLSVLGGSKLNLPVLLFYSTMYVLAGISAFWLSSWIEIDTDDPNSYKIFKPKGIVGSFVLASLVITALSLIGLPPSMGFWAKLGVFIIIWNSYLQSMGIIWLILLLLAIATTLLAFYYYAKPLVSLVLRDLSQSETSTDKTLHPPLIHLLIIVLINIPLLYFGILHAGVVQQWLRTITSG